MKEDKFRWRSGAQEWGISYTPAPRPQERGTCYRRAPIPGSTPPAKHTHMLSIRHCTFSAQPSSQTHTHTHTQHTHMVAHTEKTVREIISNMRMRPRVLTRRPSHIERGGSHVAEQNTYTRRYTHAHGLGPWRREPRPQQTAGRSSRWRDSHTQEASNSLEATRSANIRANHLSKRAL